jgi:hypothetical protein
VRLPGADFEVEIVLAIARDGSLLNICRRGIGILLRSQMQGLRGQRNDAEQEIRPDIFWRAHGVSLAPPD